jgi:hypothetical protein
MAQKPGKFKRSNISRLGTFKLVLNRGVIIFFFQKDKLYGKDNGFKNPKQLKTKTKETNEKQKAWM